MYIDKLDDTINKFTNTYHSTIKVKPVDVKSNTYINSDKEIDSKDLNYKIGNITEYQNMKLFLKKVSFQICLKKTL